MTKQADPYPKIDTVEKTDWRPREKYDWPKIAQRLRKDPGEWHSLFKQGPYSIINALRQGKIAELHPENGFEFVTENNRREAPRTADLYLRFNPEKESAMRAAVRAAKKARN